MKARTKNESANKKLAARKLSHEHRALWRLNDVLVGRIELLANELNELRVNLREANNRQDAKSRATQTMKRLGERN
jgi:predicted  nucleic acid-binding Zn-ribbon protein